jgi:prepilin signal peptidase PulO-like enzyme (type II secretory pathway)
MQFEWSINKSSGGDYILLKIGKLRGISKTFGILSIILVVFGVIILIYYLRNVEYGSSPTLLFSGVLLLTISNILAFLSVDHNKLPFLFVLFVTTLFLVTMYDVRFGV